MVEQIPQCCPRCGSKVALTAYPNTGTTVDCYEVGCEKGHQYYMEYDHIDGSVVIKLQ